jgi:S-adenosylmethionine synthetase
MEAAMSAVHASPPRANRPDYLLTAESVSAGHPDKLADRLADTILDRFLADDPTARVACECLVSGDLVVVAGEVSTSAPLFARVHGEIPALVRQLLTDTGYDNTFPGIDPERVEIRVTLQAQSADIRRGVDRPDGALGAGDQGLMFGYACDENPELMPLPLILAHRLVQRQEDTRRSGELPWLRPDAKSQVTVRYRGASPVAVETVVLSTQHDVAVPLDLLRSWVECQIVRAVIPEALLAPACRILINPTGRFVVGGPRGDTGLTGRKIIVDTYGGSCPHGGGAFSGKDPTKVDRSGAYAARSVSKNIVAAGLARRCTVQLAYAIGEPAPV